MEWNPTWEDPLTSYVKQFAGLIGDHRTSKTFAEIVKGIIGAGSLICQQIAARAEGPYTRRDGSYTDESYRESPCFPLQHKRNEPFRAPHILLIALAQMLLEDALFYMDTVAETNERTSHDDEQTQPVVRQAESKSEQRDEEAGIGGMSNEPVGACFDHSLLGCNSYRHREEGTEHGDGVETECDPSVHQENTQPEEELARVVDSGGRNLISQQHAEEETEYDQAKDDYVRPFILALSTSAQTSVCPDIYDRFYHSPDEKAHQQDTEFEQIVSDR